MSKKLGLIVLVALALLLSACSREASTAPTAAAAAPGSDSQQPAAPTDAMAVIQQALAATQTAEAANAPLGTPVVVDNGTDAVPTLEGGSNPQVVTPTVEGAVAGDTAMPLPTVDPNAPATSTPAPAAPETKPASYTLHEGEFIFCLARRFDIDPADILSLNGLVDSETVYPGLTVKLPTTGSFPGTRALKAHPASYTVQVNDTIYSIACQYGDVGPGKIAAANNLAAPYTLTVGAQIQIP